MPRRVPQSRLLPALLSWYDGEKRTMPWRGHPDPYAVWVSEIMLQQTRVDSVVPYFVRFTSRFPSVQELASADLQDVLHLWQGLGYYTRARNLHQAARKLCAEHEGVLPRTAGELRTLPGIGAYTAAAIASISFGEREPVIDGNVLRVVARLLRIGEDIRRPASVRKVDAWLRPLIAAAPVPGDFNQAMMELGALVCTPREPCCHACPLSRDCRAFRESDPLAYPVKPSTRPLPTKVAAGLILRRNGRILLVRRVGERFLGDLWELPGGFCEAGEPPAETLARTLPAQTGLTPLSPIQLGVVRQVYSHFRMELHVFEARGSVGTLLRGVADRLRWIRPGALDRVPLSNAPRSALRLAGVPDAGKDCGRAARVPASGS